MNALRSVIQAGVVLAAFAALVAAGCQSIPETRTVLVEAKDYAYLAPDSLPPGPTAFGLANAGKMAHEVIVVRLRPNAQVQEILRLDRADSSWRELRDPPSGILTADPGVTTPGQLLLNLRVGERYLLVCNFRDGDTGPAHLHLGMMKLITVHEAHAGT
jgi:hypothetical protein